MKELSPALDWLDADFDHGLQRYQRKLRRGAHDTATAACPACGGTGNLSETRITTGERAEGYALECGDCGQAWPP